MQTYAYTLAYPFPIGGRPQFAWPSFVPTVFENAVLVAIVAGFVAFMAVNRLPRLYDPIDEAELMRQASQDGWIVAVRSEDAATLRDARALLSDLGAARIEGGGMTRAALALAALALLCGCDDMIHQPKKVAYADARVGPGRLPAGMVDYRSKPAVPPPVTLALIERGQDRFRIYCTPCHSELGDGHGMVVQRGFPPPPSYHIARLRAAPVQHFYDVITNGYGAMYSFAYRVQPIDRWAIAAYIRALQRSQDATVADLTPDQKGALP